MAQVSTYLNFERSTEEAFNFYKSVFCTEFVGEIMHYGDIPVSEGESGPSDNDKNLIMNIGLPILDGHLLMGTDAPETIMGNPFTQGNNVYISLHPDTRADADRLFNALSTGGKVDMPLEEAFWGDYFGSFADKFGIRWMVNTASKT